MEPSKEAIAVRLTRLNRQILGKVTNNVNSYSKKTVDRETLLDALTVLFDECNEDGNKKCDDLVRRFLDKCKFVIGNTISSHIHIHYYIPTNTSLIFTAYRSSSNNEKILNNKFISNTIVFFFIIQETSSCFSFYGSCLKG